MGIIINFGKALGSFLCYVAWRNNAERGVGAGGEVKKPKEVFRIQRILFRFFVVKVMAAHHGGYRHHHNNLQLKNFLRASSPLNFMR